MTLPFLYISEGENSFYFFDKKNNQFFLISSVANKNQRSDDGLLFNNSLHFCYHCDSGKRLFTNRSCNVIKFLQFSFSIWKHSSMCLECMVQCYCFQSTVSESRNYWETHIKKVISALVGAAYIMKFLPETKGKNYEEISKLLS